MCWFVFNNAQFVYIILATFVAVAENMLFFWQPL